MRLLFFSLFFSSYCIAGELIIEGERIEYKDGLISASTKTRISFENMELEAETLEIEGETILCTSGHLKTERLQFFGKNIKREKQSLKIEDGWFSTCLNEKPHLRLTSKKITIGPKVVKASNIKLLLGNVCIFYVPFYSHLLEIPDSPYQMEFGRSDYLGFFVKTRYNYYFEEKKGAFLIDYYQKRHFGAGIEFNNVFGYYNKKDKWLLDVFYKKPPMTIAIERLSDRAFSYNYLKGDIKDETKSYIMLEDIADLKSKRLVFEEEDAFSKKRYCIPKGDLFFSGRESFGFTTSLDISAENIYKDNIQFTINPKISKRLYYILQTLELEANEKKGTISSTSHIRLINKKNFKQDLEYAFGKEKKILFLSEGFFPPYFGSIEGEFLISKETFDNITFSFSTPYGKIDGRYKDNKFNAYLSMGFKRLGILWLIKEKGLIIPSMLLKRDNASIKISGHYGAEDYLELSLSKAYHCINVNFMINTKQDIGINVTLR